MANSIEKAVLFTNLVDEKFKHTAKTTMLESDMIEIGQNYGEFKVMKVETSGLGTYDKNAGYAQGTTSVTWETVKPDIDLSTSVCIDHFENEEALGKAMAESINNIVYNASEEIDAIRFAKISAVACVENNLVAEDFSDANDIIKSLRNALNKMDNEAVPEDKILYATPEIIGALEDMDSFKSKAVLGRFAEVVKVPQNRFYNKVDVLTGADGNFGYKKSSDAKNLNYMIVSKSSVIGKTIPRVKLIPAEQNQRLDADEYKLRIYGLSGYAFDNKKKGIFSSNATG